MAAMKVKMRLIIIAATTLSVAGIIGYIAGTRSADAQLARFVRELALIHASKEAAIYTQVLEKLREGENECVADRLEVLLDYAVIHIGDYYAPEYDRQGWVGKSLTHARSYRTLYPHRPSTDWAAKRFDAALALKTESH
jgi:hypothetical protein